MGKLKTILFILLLPVLAIAADIAAPVKPYTFADGVGRYIRATEVNSNFDTIYAKGGELATGMNSLSTSVNNLVNGVSGINKADTLKGPGGSYISSASGAISNTVVSRNSFGNFSSTSITANIFRGTLINLTTDNVTRYVSLTDAITAIGSAPTTLVVGTTTTITANTTIPKNIQLMINRGGSIDTSSYTLAVNGNIYAGDYQAFTGNGDVVGLSESKPEWFGDNTTPGTTDMSTAVVKAIAATNGGKLILSGVYGVSGNSINIGSNMEIVFNPGASLKLLGVSSSVKAIYVGSAVTKLKITNPTIDLNYSGSTYSPQGIVIEGASNVSILNPVIYNSAVTRAWPNTGYGYGIYLLGAWSKVNVNNPRIYDIMYGVITEPSSTGSNLRVNGGSIEFISGDGVEVNVPTGSASDVVVDGTRFYRVGSNNVARGLCVGLSGASGTTVSNAKVVNSSFIECDMAGIHIEDGSKKVMVANNYFESCGGGSATTLGSAIYVAAASSGTRLIDTIQLTDNIIISGSASDYGIYAGGSFTSTGLDITNNVIKGSGYGIGILVGSVWSQLHVDGNTVTNSNGPAIKLYGQKGTFTRNLCYDDQGSKTQSYGAEFVAETDNILFRDNIFHGNINKGILRTSFTFPKLVSNYTEKLINVSAGAAAYSTWADTIYLGSAASGTITINATSGTDRSTGVFTFVWDGTTFTPTKVGITSSGNLALSGTATSVARVTAGWLQVQVFNSGGAISNMRIDVTVDGHVLVN